MKSTALKLAVAAALSVTGANAMALGIADIGGDTTLHVSGATATDNMVGNLMKVGTGSTVCVPGSLAVFSGSNQVAYFCTANFTDDGITSGTTQIVVLKESQGGSGNGIIYPAESALSFIQWTNANLSANCGTGVTTVASGDFAQFVSYACTAASLASVTPNVGISDVDPGTFEGTGGVTAAHVAKFGTSGAKSVVGVTFNPIVSTALFKSLQIAQGLDNAGAEDISSVAKLPSMTSPMLRSIFSSQMLLASQMYVNGVDMSTVSGYSGDGLIHLCRRGDTSGTMTSFKLQFLGEGCTKNQSTVNFFGAPEDSNQTTGSSWVEGTNGDDLVFAGASSGNVRSCVTYHSSQGNYAVGIASTERRPAVSGSSDVFRYIKVDGQEPTLKAVMEGRYDFFTENTFNFPTSLSSTSAQYSIFDRLYSLASTNTIIAKLNESWQNSASLGQGTTLNSGDGTGDTGLLIIPTASNNPTFPIVGTGANSVRTKPVNSQRRQAPGVGPNNCNRPYQAYPSL